MFDTPATPNRSTRIEPCNCIPEMNKALAEHNTELGVNWVWNRDGSVTTLVGIRTEILTKKRGARPVKMLPAFCPFCGIRYPEATS